MAIDASRLLLEGFPLTPTPQADIQALFHLQGVQIREVRRSTILTASNTPAWILTIDTGLDVNTILGHNWSYNGIQLCLRRCPEDDQISAVGAEGEDYPLMISGDADFECHRDESRQASSHWPHFKSMNPPCGPFSIAGQHYPMVTNPQMPYGPWFMHQHHVMTPYQQGYQHQRPAYQFSDAFPGGHIPVPMSPAPLFNMQMTPRPIVPFHQEQEFAKVPMGGYGRSPPPYLHPQQFEKNQGVETPREMAPRFDIERDFKMSKADLDTTRTIEVYDSDVEKSGRDKYFYFFENPRKGGGEIDTFEISDNNIIIIMFKDREVADHLVEKGTVNVGDVKVRIKPHEPFPVYTKKVLLQYPGAHLDRDAFELLMYVKARSKCDVQHMESGARQDALIVSFKESVDIARLQDVCKQKLFKEKMVQVFEVKAPCTLLVEGVPENISKDTLQDYFETCKTEVQEVVPSSQRGSYLVHLSDFRDTIKLVEMPHRLGHCVLEVCLYHNEIGSGKTAAVEKKIESEIKEACFLDVSPLFGRFIKKTQAVKSEIEKKMKDQGIEFTINADYKLSVRTSSTQTDQMELIESAKRILNDIVDHQSIKVPNGLDAQSLLDGLSHDPREVKLYTDKKTISVVGYLSKASEMRLKVEERIKLRGGNTTLTTAALSQEKQARMESKNNVVTTTAQATDVDARMQTENFSSQLASHVEIMTLKPLAAQYFHDHSFQNEVQKKNSGVKLVINVDNGTITVEGPDKDSVLSGLIMIHEMLNNMETIELQSVSEQQTALLNTDGVRQVLLRLQTERGIVASWNSIEIIAGSRQAAEASQRILAASVIERIIPLEPNMFTLFGSASWKNKVQKLVEVFQGKFSVTPFRDKEYLLIVGLNDNIDALYDEMSSYLEENVVQETVVPLQKGETRFLKTHINTEVDKVEKDIQQHNGRLAMTTGDSFIISGPKPSLEKATEELRKLSRTVHRRKETLTKPGMAKLMRSDKGNIIKSHVENKHRCIIETEDDTAVETSRGAAATIPERPVILAVRNLSLGRKICVRKGDITTFTVDALVNAANERLDHCGGLAKAIVEKGGKSIQEECSRYIEQHGHLDDGDAMVSRPGNLPCDVLIHAVGPKWNGGNKREDDYLQEAVTKSLEFADKKGCVSIAIPGLSTGVFGYPRMEATTVISKAVDKYFKRNQDSSIKDVYFCDTEDSTLDEFIKAMEKVFGSVSKTPTSRIEATRGGASGGEGHGKSRSDRDVVLLSGEIAKLKAEVIVSSTPESLELAQGAVSKSLLDVAGPGLQKELSQKRRTDSKEVIVTNGYNLQCKKVYHVRLPAFTTEQAAEKDIRGWVQKCLEMGNMQQVKSMMFSALGTGGLKYPRDLVAECMLDTIQQFWIKNTTTLLTDVKIVLYVKDHQTKKAFEDIKSQLGERASQKLKPVLKRGDITRFQAHVIVNATDESLNLNRGRLSKSINDAAGPNLSAECQQKYPNGCPKSGVAVTTAGLLNARNIYHVIVPSWKKENGEKNLMNAVKFCLEEAHANNHQSILFPTLGVGLQGYKKAVAARCMFKAIDSFWTSHPGTSLQGVQIVIYEDDTAKEYEKELKTFFSSRPVSRKNRKLKTESGEEDQDTNIDVREGVTIGNIHFRLVNGDVLKENVDCVVCAVHAEFDLDRGTINRILLERFPSDFTSWDLIKAKDLKSKGYTVTEVSTGPFRHLLHFEQFFFDHDVAKILKKCFTFADGLNCISVALPALGQGPKGGVPERILMEHLYDTLIKLKDLKNVKEVRLVLFEEDMYERFMLLFSELVKKQGLKAKGKWQGPYLKKDSVPVAHHAAKRQLLENRRRSKGEGVEGSVDVWFFSDIEANIELAKEELLFSSDKEFDDKKVENHAIRLFSEKRMEQLYEEARGRGVVLKIDVRLGRCRVKGIKDDTHWMIQRILEVCIDQKDDDSIASTVQWCCIDETAVEELVKYDEHTNKNLEKTFREGKETYRLEDTEGKGYIVDFVRMVEFIEGDPTSECAVLRKDLLNAEEVDFPASWQLGVAENLKIIRLDQASSEFQRVASKFARTKRQIIKIERIQNKTLYRQYQAKKKLFEQRSTNTKPVEQEIWHGTAKEAIPSINKEGFNRSFCGKNAVVFGNGVYFAVDPSYSIQDRYARKDTLGNQYIYLVDVLTGEYTNGKTGMRVPPPRNPRDPSVLFDSVVDNINAPTMYIIFNDTQAYPKYLITFK